jgi:nucleotidyltransferase substrate binding protein (TIGR01987 family)
MARNPEALGALEKEGAIRRFEYCLDAGWKAAREFLENSGLRIAPVTPREVIRQAAAAGLVANAQIWIDMFNHRTLLAHNYDGVVITEVISALATRYFPAMEKLHESLTAQAHSSGV